MTTIFENDFIKVSTTGQDYDFIAVIENKTDKQICVHYDESGYNDNYDPILIEPNDWIGLLANDEGYDWLKAIKNNQIYIESHQEDKKMTKTINKTTKLYAGDKFAITTTDGRKLRLVIEQDQFSEDPRSWDNLGTMLCCHRDYQLGDCNSNRETEEQLAEICRKYGKSDEEIDEMTFGEEVRFILDQDDVCGLPLWLYDHSGISISTGRRCAWDSSFIGLIFVEKDFYLAQTCIKDEENWKERARRTLEGEIETYSDFLEGNVYMWTLYEPTVVIRQSMDGKELSREIDEEGEMVDSMSWSYDPTLEDVKEYFDFDIAEIEQIND